MHDAPQVFMSYSHDNQVHKDWVLTLSTRLVANGVDVLLDQWNRLGSDLPSFMEQGLTEAHRVIAICTDNYVRKANGGYGGVGYEKMILTGQLVCNINTDRLIPIIRENKLSLTLPTFLTSRLYLDFRNEQMYEARYAELLRDIHGMEATPRPPLGQNPFTKTMPEIDPRISFSSERYVSPALSGSVTFDYSNNNGRFVVGAGDMLFETAWSRGSSAMIHAYTDPPSIRTIGLAERAREITEITDATIYDTSSRVRSVRIGGIAVWQNSAGYYLATKVEELESSLDRSASDKILFSYVIAPLKSVSFHAPRC